MNINFLKKMEKQKKLLLKDKKLKDWLKAGGRKEEKQDFFRLLKRASLLSRDKCHYSSLGINFFLVPGRRLTSWRKNHPSLFTACFSVASKRFTISIATLTGPTPPGVGV